MYRRHKHAPATYRDHDFRNLLICPADVVVKVGEEPGQMALIHPKPSQVVREGDFINDRGSLFRLEGFVCSMGFHRDEIVVYRVVEVDG